MENQNQIKTKAKQNWKDIKKKIINNQTTKGTSQNSSTNFRSNSQFKTEITNNDFQDDSDEEYTQEKVNNILSELSKNKK